MAIWNVLIGQRWLILEVPYNILMGKQWAFHGWTDWAYKQGNFHERYLLDIINALQQKGRLKDAAKLRREWEKKGNLYGLRRSLAFWIRDVC